MARALALAERGRGRTTPNPIVGAVVVSRAGVVVGQGAHMAAGGPHAEVVALAEAGERARGATLYCTLEPCAHTGRTGPCCERIVDGRDSSRGRGCRGSESTGGWARDRLPALARGGGGDRRRRGGRAAAARAVLHVGHRTSPLRDREGGRVARWVRGPCRQSRGATDGACRPIATFIVSGPRSTRLPSGRRPCSSTIPN